MGIHPLQVSEILTAPPALNFIVIAKNALSFVYQDCGAAHNRVEYSGNRPQLSVENGSDTA
jgi:hypothetical protein